MLDRDELLDKELEGLTAVKTKLMSALPHVCCDCDAEDVPCLEEAGCTVDYCEICRPHMHYIENVLDPRIERLEALLNHEIHQTYIGTKN